MIESVPPAGPEASESTPEENEDDIQFVSVSSHDGRVFRVSTLNPDVINPHLSGHRSQGTCDCLMGTGHLGAWPRIREYTHRVSEQPPERLWPAVPVVP